MVSLDLTLPQEAFARLLSKAQFLEQKVRMPLERRPNSPPTTGCFAACSKHFGAKPSGISEFLTITGLQHLSISNI